MQLLKLPFVRISLALITGIICYYKHPFLPIWPGFSCLAFACLLLFDRTQPPRVFRHNRHWLGGAALLCLAYTGYCLAHGQYLSQHPSKSLQRLHTQPLAYTGTVIDIGLTSKNRVFLRIGIRSIQNTTHAWQAATGHVMVYWPSPLPCPAQIGDTLFVAGHPSPIPPASNPGGFDYRAYMEGQGVGWQHFLRKTEGCLIRPAHQSSWRKLVYHIRTYCTATLRHYLTAPTAFGIANALVLGSKAHLDANIKASYAQTGAMHILAVSGLHVGMVAGIIGWLLGSRRYRRPHVYWAIPLQILLIWAYALLTGMSPSVMRAACMFSLLALGQAGQLHQHPGNTIAVSAFLLLCADTTLLFQVGFQLSFAAVLGIIYWQPPLYRWWRQQWHSRWKLQDWAVQLGLVSIAAQAATLPISLYYFHQFPTYFLLSNFVAIPVAGWLLPLGLALLALGAFAPLAGGIAWAIELLIGGMNTCMLALGRLPFDHIANIPFDAPMVAMTYALLYGVVQFLLRKKWAYLCYITACCTLLFAYRAWHCQQQSQRLGWAVYAHSSVPIAYIDGGKLRVLHDTAKVTQASLLVGAHALQLQASHQLQAWSKPAGKNMIPFKNVAAGHLAVWRGQSLLVVTAPPSPTPLPWAHCYLIRHAQARAFPSNASGNYCLLSPELSGQQAIKWEAQAKAAGLSVHRLRDEAWQYFLRQQYAP